MGSIQEFILKRKQLGHITTARFNVSMTFGSGWGKPDLLEDDAIEFSLASIDLPTVRGNYEQVYFDTMPVEVFKNFTYDPDFSMTVICDNEGRIYKQFLNLILRKENVVDNAANFNDSYEGNCNFKQMVDPDITLTITALGDRDTKSGQMHFGFANYTSETGMIFKLTGVYIKNIGNLSFANNSSEIMTFSVNAAATTFDVITKEDNGMAFSNGIHAIKKIVSPFANAIESAIDVATSALSIREGGTNDNDKREQTDTVMPEDEKYENFRDRNPDIVNEESPEGPKGPVPIDQKTSQVPSDQNNTLKATKDSSPPNSQAILPNNKNNVVSETTQIAQKPQTEQAKKSGNKENVVRTNQSGVITHDDIINFNKTTNAGTQLEKNLKKTGENTYVYNMKSKNGTEAEIPMTINQYGSIIPVLKDISSNRELSKTEKDLMGQSAVLHVKKHIMEQTKKDD